jgi:hypothetical protein
LFLDLGNQPLSNAYLHPGRVDVAELSYPLHVFVCDGCFLVQLEAFQTPAQIFADYAYFSSFSDSWLEHGARFARTVGSREQLDSTSLIMEIASNDGYLLRHFRACGMPVIGIEPAQNVARVAVAAGVPTINEFFGESCARGLALSGHYPRLLIANNVLAHVPDLHDFVAGMAVLIDDRTLATIEVPHVLRLIEACQFDTIYHEHFSYFSLLSLEPVFAAHGLSIVDVEELATHGGSLRLFVRRSGTVVRGPNVEALRERERRAKLDDIETYFEFARRVIVTKRRILTFLLTAQEQGRLVAGYGAPAKGNTFLNYCGIRQDLVAFTVDRSPHKQGLSLPGSHLPILHPDAIFDRQPYYVLILPWNIADEVMEQMSGIRHWGGRFVTAIPRVCIY